MEIMVVKVHWKHEIAELNSNGYAELLCGHLVNRIASIVEIVEYSISVA